MKYIEIKPHKKLTPFIHSFWELRGDEQDKQWDGNFKTKDKCENYHFLLQQV
jgi:hypothetical protein